MIITLHGLSTMHSNARTDIRLAREAGFDGYEIVEMKLLRYLNQGYQAEELLPLFEQYQIRPVCINALKDVDHGQQIVPVVYQGEFDRFTHSPECRKMRHLPGSMQSIRETDGCVPEGQRH